MSNPLLHLGTSAAAEAVSSLLSALAKALPNGHPEFLPTTLREAILHDAKNHDYAAGGSALGNFDRVAAILALYPDLRLGDRKVVALTYLLKQLDAVLWSLSSRLSPRVEGLSERLQDISIYAKLVMCMLSDEKQAAEPQSPPRPGKEPEGDTKKNV